MSTQPTTEELEDISLCAQKLWDLDTNRLEPEVDYGINVQGGKRTFWTEDVAENRLFRGVARSVWERPSYRAFYVLLDNYEKETGRDETMTPQEQQESVNFINEVMKSAPMQYVHNYLVEKSLADSDEAAFKSMVFQLWFGFYRRDSRQDSSGFEHVFVGESDENQTKGFHNWIQFFIEEASGRVDYRGYIFPRSRRAPAPDGNERLLSLQLAWEGEVKTISSFLIGTSPEFELALYTLYFVAGEQNNLVDLLNYRVDIKCYRIHGDRIGTVFCSIEDET